MLNVFLVDDDRHVLQAMTELLEALPDVHVVGSSNGLQVLSACRVRWSNQRIVVLSNHLDAAARRRCAAMGADAAFMKDSDIGLLLNYCDAASRSRK